MLALRAFLTLCGDVVEIGWVWQNLQLSFSGTVDSEIDLRPLDITNPPSRWPNNPSTLDSYTCRLLFLQLVPGEMCQLFEQQMNL